MTKCKQTYPALRDTLRSKAHILFLIIQVRFGMWRRRHNARCCFWYKWWKLTYLSLWFPKAELEKMKTFRAPIRHNNSFWIYSVAFSLIPYGPVVVPGFFKMKWHIHLYEFTFINVADILTQSKKTVYNTNAVLLAHAHNSQKPLYHQHNEVTKA